MRFSYALVLILFVTAGALARLEITEVEFDRVVSSDSGGDWHETRVSLRWVSDRSEYSEPVTLEVWLAWAGDADTVDDYDYFQARCELAGLRRGERVDAPFYLPPAVADAADFTDAPDYWVVRAVEKGRDPILLTEIRIEELRDRFLRQAEASAPLRNGFLQPIYLTPFWTRPEYREDVAAFLRKDSR